MTQAGASVRATGPWGRRRDFRSATGSNRNTLGDYSRVDRTSDRSICHVVGGRPQTSSPSRPRRIGAADVSRASILRTPTSSGAVESGARNWTDWPTSFSRQMSLTKSGSVASRIAEWTSQSLALLSRLQVRMRASSFEKTASKTAPSWLRAGPIAAPVAASQSRAVVVETPSQDPGLVLREDGAFD